MINYVTKRPTEQTLRTVILEERERGNLYGAVDLGAMAREILDELGTRDPQRKRFSTLRGGSHSCSPDSCRAP